MRGEQVWEDERVSGGRKGIREREEAVCSLTNPCVCMQGQSD